MDRIESPEGLDWYEITHESGASLQVSRHAGHALSWKTADGVERFYLSPKADFSPDKAIRGGVPIIFPQFSDHGPFGRHGFARKSAWEVDPETDLFRLETTPASWEEWPHKFELKLSFALEAESLEMTLELTNPGDAAFEFHAAFHSYLKVADVRQCTVSGLEECAYFDEAAKSHHDAEGSPVTFGEEVDRAYLKAADRVATLEEAGEALLSVETGGFEDVVVWNPGPDHGIGDLPENGWTEFVCIESAQTDKRLSLAPGASWAGTQRIRISSES